MFNETSTLSPNLTHTVKVIIFSWYDYIFFTLLMVVSVLIGIYFGCFGSKQSTTNEYLLGGKKMSVIPVAISLIASHTSGITLLAVPADIYKYGAAYWWGNLSIIFVIVVTAVIFLPIFYKLQITSTYEYLERRFDGRVRKLASFLYALNIFLYLPIVIYVSALCFAAASGINLYLITGVICAVCIFYTAIGGLKAVVWTDTLQFVIIIGSLIAVFILGLTSAGGISTVWQKAIEGGRLDVFDFDLDPTRRDTFWVTHIGTGFNWVSQMAVSQSYVQKYLSVPTLRDATISVIIFCLGYVAINSTSVIIGLIMYAKYGHCDPFTTKTITRNDQLLPYYVLDVASEIPGLPGLFIAGVFSAGLSTLSACLNCLAGTIFEDFIVKMMKNKESRASSGILKLLVVILGVICTALVIVFQHLGGILPLTISLTSIVHGPQFGLFVLGALVPSCNSKGAFSGSMFGLVSMAIIWSVSKYYEKQGLGYNPKPVSVDGCSAAFNETLLRSNITLKIPEPMEESNLFVLFRICFYYYTLLGTVLTVVAGMALSYAFRSKDDEKEIDKSLLSPLVHRFVQKKEQKESPDYLPLDIALHVTTVNKYKEADIE